MYLKYARLVKIYNFPSVKELFRLIRGALKAIFWLPDRFGCTKS